jgi:hypothetical protein
MTFIEAKKKLHDYIEHANEAEVMEMMSFVNPENDMNNRYVVDESTLNVLRERSDEYLSGKAVTYSFEETMEILKSREKRNEI